MRRGTQESRAAAVRSLRQHGNGVLLRSDKEHIMPLVAFVHKILQRLAGVLRRTPFSITVCRPIVKRADAAAVTLLKTMKRTPLD